VRFPENLCATTGLILKVGQFDMIRDFIRRFIIGFNSCIETEFCIYQVEKVSINP